MKCQVMLRRAAAGVLCCLAGGCEVASFESLGTLPPNARESPAVDAGADRQDAALPQLHMDAAPVAAPPAQAPMVLDAGQSPPASTAAAGAPAAGSGGAAGPPAMLSGTLDGMPFSLKAGYVSGLTDEIGQTRLYLFDSAVSCSQISSFTWLSQLPSSVHVVEVVFPSTASTGVPVSNINVSYALGGTYSFSKTRASSSSLVLSKLTQAGAVDGALMASFGTNSIEGAFHAEYCASGTGL